MITLSQSGETADTLAACVCRKSWVTLVRWQSVTFRFFSGARIRSGADDQRGYGNRVASTKAFTTQLTVLLMLVASCLA